MSVVYFCCSPSGKRFDRKSELEKYLKNQHLPYEENQFNFSVNFSSPKTPVKFKSKKPITTSKNIRKNVQTKKQLRKKLADAGITAAVGSKQLRGKVLH